jgi:aminoglycoside phosphotransferase (APT) family kinase protein
MNHADLMPGNVLVTGDRRLAGVLDVGELRAADPALDLVGAWHLLESGPRQALRESLGTGDLEWARGKAWAFQQSMGLVWYYADSNPVMAAIGRRTLDRLLADERPLPSRGISLPSSWCSTMPSRSRWCSYMRIASKPAAPASSSCETS